VSQNVFSKIQLKFSEHSSGAPDKKKVCKMAFGDILKKTYIIQV